MQHESIKSHPFVSRVSRGQFEKKIHWKIMSFCLPAFQMNLAIGNCSPSPRIRFCLFWPGSMKETKKPLNAIVTLVSKPFSTTFATLLILRSKTPVTRPFCEKYLGPAVLSSGKSSEKIQLMKSFAEHPIHAIESCWSLWPKAECESVRC